MPPPVVVPDASVILKWVLPDADEPEAAAALQLRDKWLAHDIRLVVPALWAFEAGSVLTRKAGDRAVALMAALVELEIEEGAFSEFADGAFALCHRFGVTFYDASYHALARARRGTFITADDKYVRKVADASVLSLRHV